MLGLGEKTRKVGRHSSYSERVQFFFIGKFCTIIAGFYGHFTGTFSGRGTKLSTLVTSPTHGIHPGNIYLSRNNQLSGKGGRNKYTSMQGEVSAENLDMVRLRKTQRMRNCPSPHHIPDEMIIQMIIKPNLFCHWQWNQY